MSGDARRAMLAPIDSPRGKRYFVENRGGWNRCLKGDVSGSASSARKGRSFRRISDGTKAGEKQKVKADGQRMTAEQVLGKDDDCISCYSHGVSPSEDR